jgi:CRISPR-associated protein Cas1
MVGRIVEIAEDQKHLRVDRGFMVVDCTSSNTKELDRIPLDDIAAVIVSAHGISYTNNFLVALAERGVPFVLCGSNFKPVGLLIGLDGNHEQAKRFDAQCNASKPKIKQLWATVVRSKLEQQATTLFSSGKIYLPLLTLARRVRSGDPDNLEAQGARIYWSLLFGETFRRDQGADGINSLLNYGYTVLRAATARAIVAAGLHPTISLHHSNASNPMRLADDLMEPFRPLIDKTVLSISLSDDLELTPTNKKILVQTLYEDMATDRGSTPTINCIHRLATSLAQVFLNERVSLDLPTFNHKKLIVN